jgi:hypothetical protein
MAIIRPICYPYLMQVTINIPDELAAQVRSRGLTPQSYVEQLISEQAATARGSAPHKLSLEEFEASLDELTRYSDKIPVLPTEALSRESLYQDHD